MNINLSETRRKTLSVNQYVESLEQPFQDRFLTFKSTYQLDREALECLKKNSGKYVLVAFSASWCKDRAKSISVLAMLSDAVGLEVRIFGGLKKDPLSAVSKWRIPPSPPEVESFRVDKIPLIIVFDEEGKEVGRIVETPKFASSVECEISEIIKCRQ
jgi:thiol-disulfide isomerase/thioredoxin